MDWRGPAGRDPHVCRDVPYEGTVSGRGPQVSFKGEKHELCRMKACLLERLAVGLDMMANIDCGCAAYSVLLAW